MFLHVFVMSTAIITFIVDSGMKEQGCTVMYLAFALQIMIGIVSLKNGSVYCTILPLSRNFLFILLGGAKLNFSIDHLSVFQLCPSLGRRCMQNAGHTWARSHHPQWFVGSKYGTLKLTSFVMFCHLYGYGSWPMGHQEDHHLFTSNLDVYQCTGVPLAIWKPMVFGAFIYIDR